MEAQILKWQMLMTELVKQPKETEWIEFKENNADPQMIGENISALSNTCTLLGKKRGYLVWGVNDSSHEIVGTTFNPSSTKHKNQELESWILQKISPRINFKFCEFTHNDKAVVILEIYPAANTPVRFDGTEYIRIGSNTKKLRDFPEKERELWRAFDRVPFEEQIAISGVNKEKVIQLIDYTSYFKLLDQPVPETHDGIIEVLVVDSIINRNDAGLFDVTNLGAILFAYNLSDFKQLSRKAVRIIFYKGVNKLETIRELQIHKGYAVGYEEMIEKLILLLPANEVIGKAFRRETSMYPVLALRELIANALIHQDFNFTGTSPCIEVFKHRIEITNPGSSLIAIDRLMDNPPRSRNEGIASLMRRMGICEERGSGIDKVVVETEINQLPAPLFEMSDEYTRAVLFSYRDFKDIDKSERMRACYLHSVLKYISQEPMTNSTLRERFGVAPQNSAMISRIIKQAIEIGVIKLYDPTAGTKSARYIPFWA